MLKGIFQTMKYKVIEALFSSRNSSCLSPLIRCLVSLRLLNVWEGVYSCWEKAPQDDDVFEGKIWLSKVTSQAQEAIAAYRSDKNVPSASSTQDRILSLVGGTLLPSIKGNLCVLDFGGGIGASYFPLISSIPDPEKVEFHVVEGKTVCEQSQKIAGDFSKLHFHEQLPKLSKPVHIVHAGSSFQYVSDWKGLLAEFINYRPHILILQDLLAGNIPTFVTAQNFYGKKLPVRFLNINELIEEAQALDYQLIYKSKGTQNFLSEAGGPLPMENFSPQYRLSYCSHLMFKRMES